MLALRFAEGRVLELTEEPEPVPGEGETLLDVTMASVCGSDLHGVLPGGFRTPPLIMGHEFCGRTPDGRLVAVRATLGCGACRYCGKGFESVCPDRVIIGIDHPGGFQERAAVPTRALAELPPDADPVAGAIVEPLAVALHAWRRVAIAPEDRIAVLGCGTIGLLLVLIAARFGRTDLTVTDLDDRRRELAERLGATASGTALQGTYDLVFDAVGASSTRHASVTQLNPAGSAVWLGCQGPDPAFDALNLIRQEKSVRASFAYTAEDFREAAAIAPTLDLSWIEVFPFSESKVRFEQMLAKELDATKIAFSMSDTSGR